jgi:hypothetical protein
VLDANYGATGLRSCAGTGGSTSNIQFVDIDCKNGWQGFVGNGTNIEYIRVWSHGHGFGPNGENTCKGADGVNLTAERCHGFYLQAGASGRFTITESRLWGNNGYGFQSYQTGVTLQHSVFEGNTSGGAIIIGPGGNISNNCFARQETPIQCAGCTQEGNILNAGVCAGPPPPQNVPAPQNLRATVR